MYKIRSWDKFCPLQTAEKDKSCWQTSCCINAGNNSVGNGSADPLSEANDLKRI